MVGRAQDSNWLGAAVLFQQSKKFRDKSFMCLMFLWMERECFEEILGVNNQHSSYFYFFALLIDVCFLCTWVTHVSMILSFLYVGKSIQLYIITSIVELLGFFFFL